MSLALSENRAGNDNKAGAARRSGREARLAEREGRPAQTSVRPGMEGGRYQPLTRSDLDGINEAALTVLETVGLAYPTKTAAALLTRAGATIGRDGRMRFPRALVLDMVAKAARGITLFGQKPQHDIAVGGKRVHFGTAGAAVHFVDVETRSYRPSRLRDIYDAARLVDVMDNVHFFQRPMVARDIVDPFEMDLNTLYASVTGTTKHVGTSFTARESVEQALPLLYALAGDEAKFRARPFVSVSNAFVVPPLRFAEDACGVLEASVAGGLPILLLSVGQAGATAPASLVGAIVQTVAEVLAGLTYVNALKPGHPALFGTWPFVSDLRTGTMAGGAPEQALITAACAQMAHYYDLPGASAAGMTDAKLPDIQSGYEKGITNVMAGLSGLNLVYEAAGMHASLLGFCPESLIIDNDMLGNCMRCVRGFETADVAKSVEEIAKVCLDGPGHYMAQPQTRALMQSQYYYPALADRSNPLVWQERDRPDIVARATAEKRRILAEHFPRHVPRPLDDHLRQQFPAIQLPRKVMG